MPDDGSVQTTAALTSSASTRRTTRPRTMARRPAPCAAQTDTAYSGGWAGRTRSTARHPRRHHHHRHEPEQEPGAGTEQPGHRRRIHRVLRQQIHLLSVAALHRHQASDTDGNPATIADPTWTPLVRPPTTPDTRPTTPASPPATPPSTASARPLLPDGDQHRPTPNRPTSSAQLINEIANARIWGGVHPFSTTAGQTSG